MVGSQRLIEYFVGSAIMDNSNSQLEKNETFLILCIYGHLVAAQWFHSHTGGNFDTGDLTSAFRGACLNSDLSVAQWVYSLRLSVVTC
jgi:hypothetical protein